MINVLKSIEKDLKLTVLVEIPAEPGEIAYKIRRQMKENIPRINDKK